MQPLRQKMLDGNRFLWGFELVSTRGPMGADDAVTARRLADELIEIEELDWISITDNAGGNPRLSPVALGKPILYAGKDVLVHLSCKDSNRHGLQSVTWQLASEGYSNLLVMTGDYPGKDFRGRGKPVFDLDSVGLLTLLGEMNAHQGTEFFLGAVTTNFKHHENELIPQYLKLEKKVECGARFVITQIGFDARKSHELLGYLQRTGNPDLPVVGNVFLLSAPLARFFQSGRIPGVVVSDTLLTECERRAQSPDRGKAFFLELAAKQAAIFRGLGYRGAYLGGTTKGEDVRRIVEIESSFGPSDWKEFAREIQFSRPGEFYYLAKDPTTGLADFGRLNPDYEASLEHPGQSRNVTWGYRLSKRMHRAAFDPAGLAHSWLSRIYSSSRDGDQGPPLLRWLERHSKSILYDCRDCGDCSLPEISYLCPESACAKNQRNGPCGGTREGLCEVDDFECIWARAYDRLKWEGRSSQLLDHAPAIQDESLRGTSSWANTLLGRDHLCPQPPKLVQLNCDNPGKDSDNPPIHKQRETA